MLDRRHFLTQSAAAAAVAATSGCGRGERVVVYTALDSEFSEPILQDYQRQAGVRVLPKFDVESTKTVGLANAIIAESTQPRCDLFWNNEFLNTLRLKRRGLLAPLDVPEAKAFPAEFRDSEGFWCGFAARVRILLVNTERVSENAYPASILDLADERFRGRTSMAKPLFGTTASHAACLFAAWGEERAKNYFRSLKANEVQIAGGNRSAAQAAGAGEVDFAITDTDDALLEVRAGRPVKIIYPDQGEGGEGALFIPNTLAVIQGAPHAAQARRLASFLLTPEIERRLATGESGQIPLHPDAADAPLQVASHREKRSMTVNFDDAAEQWDAAAEFLTELFGA